MKYSLNALAAAYHATELASLLSRLPHDEADSVMSLLTDAGLSPKALDGLRPLLGNGLARRGSKKRAESSLGDFRFDDVMHRLRNAVMHSPSAADAEELDWLLKIILTSPAVFETVRELDNFLSNMTGTSHATKSTGRDRVVDWYFKHINSLPADNRSHVYLKIAKHIFAKGSSNYREWKEVLYGGSGR